MKDWLKSHWFEVAAGTVILYFAATMTLPHDVKADLGGKIDEIAKQQKESNRLTEINAAKIDQLIELNGLTPPEAD